MNSTIKHYLGELFRDITSLGSAAFYGAVCLVVLAYGSFSFFWNLIIGFFFTGIVITLVRLLYFKPRPNKQEHKNWIEKIDASSFPSWHSARVMYLALVFLGISKIFDAVLLLLAGLVVYSRIYLKKHDWMDVIFGIGLGYLSYLLITFFFF